MIPKIIHLCWLSGDPFPKEIQKCIDSWKEHLPDYVFKMNYHQNFNILQLTDIHWNVNSSTTSSKQYLDKVLKEADAHCGGIDLVELTGDQFMLANTYHVKTFVEYFEAKAVQYNFKYANQVLIL